MSTTWHPSWWNELHGSAWDRIKEAIRRDWEQTKHDLHLSGGHELNQGIGDTLKQAADRQPIPADDRPNPPKVIGSWDEAEVPVGYGYTARQHYGAEHPTWNEGIELRLRSEWERGQTKAVYAWDHVKGWVRHGYEYDGKP
jgi:hypothetical protein